MVVAAGDGFLGSCDQKFSIYMGPVPDGDDFMGLV
jgi:hypothetical protein